jgi:TonB family protein
MVLRALSSDRLVELRHFADRADKRRFLAILVSCSILYATGISVLALWGGNRSLPPPPDEISVDLVEPPVPEKAAEPDPPPPPVAAQPFDEKPATDAPRAPDKDTVEKEASEQSTQAPDQGQPSPSARADASALSDPHSEQSQSKGPEDVETRPDAVPLDMAGTPDAASVRQTPPLEPTPKSSPTPPKRMAAFVTMPDYRLAPAAKFTPISGGKADATYLAILYGLLTARLQTPASAKAQANSSGEIFFNVDGGGNLIQQRVIHSSGSVALDAAAMSAIREASPFPKTPTGSPLGLRFTYSAK